MIYSRAVPAIALCAALLAACATPPPKGLAPPAATEAETAPEGERTTPTAPPGGRLVALRVSVENPPPGLLDDRGAGVLTLRREGEFPPAPLRLVFLDGALGIYALRQGVYRVETVAGHDCGEIFLTVAPRAEPVAAGGLELAIHDEATASLAGRLPTLEDMDRIAGLTGVAASSVDAEPLERRQGVACERRPRAVSRPDIDPTIRKLTPGEIAGVILLGGLLGAATGGAAATGSIVFVSGTAGGLLVLGL